MRKKTSGHIISLTVILFVVVWCFNLISVKEGYPGTAVLSDSFMVPGVCFLGIALMKMADYYGSFDLVLYTASWTVSSMSKNRDSAEERRKRSLSFPAYKKERELKRCFPTPYFAAGGLLSAAAVFVALLV